MTIGLTPAKPNVSQPSGPTLSAGGRRTLGELYDHFGPVAYSLAYSITRDRERAERVVTRAFAEAWEAEGSRGSAQEFFAALMNAVRSNAVALRESRHVDAAIARFESAAVATGRGSPERAVFQALQELPDSQREVLALAYFGGLAVSEIAVELQTQVRYVRENLQAAMRHLRSLLSQRPSGKVSE